MKFSLVIFAVLMMFFAVFSTVMFAAEQYPVSSDTEGHVYADFDWFDDGHYKIHLSIPVADIEGYERSIVPRMLCPLSVDRFITEDTTVKEIAEKFDEMTKGHTDEYRVNFVNSFISNCISYKTDLEVHGHREYFQYPVETLLLRSGDCEDMAILCTSILRAMGFDSILLVGADHCITGVNMDASGGYTDVLGSRFYHLDSTSGTPIGTSDSWAIPLLSIYKDIAFVISVVIMIICIMAYSCMIWKEEEL